MTYDRFKEGNPEYDRYIHSSAWRKKADERMRLDGGICRVCGKPATEVHHLTYDNFRNEKPEELVSLCRCCHNKAEEFYDPANIMCMGARVIGLGVAKTCVDAFLETEFDGGRHKQRVDNIMKIEKDEF